ncbi:MAG: ABC transporter permease subunit [Pasteurellaceae bacterium]|nr:ABC transporter permease subunit [Pasteurellaceae bacterium]
MIGIFCRRILLTLITLFILSVISYIILARDPLNQPLFSPNVFVGYLYYAEMLLHGDLGITYNGGESLISLILTVLPPTLELCFAAMILALVIGIPLGFIGALNRHQWCGKAINILSSFGLSLPIFWLAPILLYFAAIHHWEISAVGQINLLYEIPAVTGFDIIDVWFVDQPYRIKIIQSVLQHLVLPTLVLAISPTMEITRLVKQRAEFIFTQNFSKVAITRGWSAFRILRKYGIRDTLPLLIPQTTNQFTLVLAQCMLIESSFGWPGIGRWLIEAVAQQDYNSISAGVVAIGVTIILINLVNGLFSFLLDPLGRKGWYAR